MTRPSSGSASPQAPAARTAILFVDPSQPICLDAMRALAAAETSLERDANPATSPIDVRIVVVEIASTAAPAAEPGRGFAGRDSWRRVAGDAPRPAPFDAIAALPTLVIVGPDDRIERALVGVQDAASIARLLRGDAALPATPPKEPG